MHKCPYVRTTVLHVHNVIMYVHRARTRAMARSCDFRSSDRVKEVSPVMSSVRAFRRYCHLVYATIGAIGPKGLRKNIPLAQSPSITVRTICDRIWEKGALRAVAEFLFSIAHNFKTNSYRLETRCGCFTIIALHSLKISRPAHLRFGRGKRQYRTRSKIACFMSQLRDLPFQVRK